MPNQGQTFWQDFSGSNPLTAAAPTGSEAGQPMDGLSAITVVASSRTGGTLAAAGTLQCYVLDSGYLQSSCAGWVVSASNTSPSASLVLADVFGVFDAGGTVRQLSGTVSGGHTSWSVVATGTVGSFTPQSNNSGTLFLTGLSGTFSAGFRVTGSAEPRWVRLPDGDLTVTLSTRDQMFEPVVVETGRKGRIAWVPSAVSVSSGSLRVTQLGMSFASLSTAGKWSE